MVNDGDGKEARSAAARLMGSVMTPAKRAAVLKAAQFAGRKKGTLQTQETKDKIRASRLRQEAEKQAARAVSGLPVVDAEPKRPRGHPRKTAAEVAQLSTEAAEIA